MAEWTTDSTSSRQDSVCNTAGGHKVSEPPDNPKSNLPERRTAPVAGELARYKVDIDALSETRFSDQGELEEAGAGHTFFWICRPRSEKRDAGVAFAIRNDIVGRLPCLPQGTSNRLMSLRLPLRGGKFATIVSVFAPLMTSPDAARKNPIKDATWMPSQSRHCHLLDDVLVRRRYHRDMLVKKAIPDVHWWTGHRLITSKVRVRLQPPRRPQGNRPQLNGWLDNNDAATSNLLVEKNRVHKAYVNRAQATKQPSTVIDAFCNNSCGKCRRPGWFARPRRSKKTLTATNGIISFPRSRLSTVPQPKALHHFSAPAAVPYSLGGQILQRWVERFRGVPNRPSTVSDAAIARLSQVETKADPDLPPSLHETIMSVQQPSSGKAPGSDAVPAEV
ncbi:hypothetical protein SprV_0301075100 [Sparganum proliferum]